MENIKKDKELTDEQKHTRQFLEALKNSKLTPRGYYDLSIQEREVFDERIAKKLGISKNDLKHEFSVQRTLFSTRRYNISPENPSAYRSWEDEEIYRIFGSEQNKTNLPTEKEVEDYIIRGGGVLTSS